MSKFIQSNPISANIQLKSYSTIIKEGGQKDNNETNNKNNLHQQNGIIISNSSNERQVEQPETRPMKIVKVSNIIGDFGPYQIAVVIFAALRALACAMDGLSGPFLSPTIKNYQCEVCDISSPSSTSTSIYTQYNKDYMANITIDNGVCSLVFNDTSNMRYSLDPTRCYFAKADSTKQDRIYCKRWTFNNLDSEKLINSLTVEQNLVCDKEWLKSLSNSMYFVGATFGLLFWGVISDRYGRKTAYVCSHFVTLIFGFSSLFANSMCTYILLRSINAFGMIGELIPRSIQVEIVATEYRFICSVICQIGWATGIILVPALAYVNPGYRFILAFPVALSAIMLPWLIWLPESARWLITNYQYPKAREELRRAARLNGKLTDEIDSMIEQFNRQVLREEVNPNGRGKRIGIGRSILAIFTNVHLLKDTLSVFILLFVAEVVYFSLTLNVADLGGSIYVNYIISGMSELVSIAFCAVILAYLSRRMCLSLLLLASTVSYLLMAFVSSYEESLSMTLILSVNAFGKLTAIGNLMVIILVSQEVFPTVIRQFGTSLCITIGKAGSAVAPFTHELGQIIGHSYCFAMFSLICLSCAIIPFVLSETGNRELPDTVIDVEDGINRAKNERHERSKQSADEINNPNRTSNQKSVSKETENPPNSADNDTKNIQPDAPKPVKGNQSNSKESPAILAKSNSHLEDLNNNNLDNRYSASANRTDLTTTTGTLDGVSSRLGLGSTTSLMASIGNENSRASASGSSNLTISDEYIT